MSAFFAKHKAEGMCHLFCHSTNCDVKENACLYLFLSHMFPYVYIFSNFLLILQRVSLSRLFYILQTNP